MAMKRPDRERNLQRTEVQRRRGKPKDEGSQDPAKEEPQQTGAAETNPKGKPKSNPEEERARREEKRRQEAEKKFSRWLEKKPPITHFDAISLAHRIIDAFRGKRLPDMEEVAIWWQHRATCQECELFLLQKLDELYLGVGAVAAATQSQVDKQGARPTTLPGRLASGFLPALGIGGIGLIEGAELVGQIIENVREAGSDKETHALLREIRDNTRPQGRGGGGSS